MTSIDHFDHCDDYGHSEHSDDFDHCNHFDHFDDVGTIMLYHTLNTMVQ